jgi:hypothetical protein
MRNADYISLEVSAKTMILCTPPVILENAGGGVFFDLIYHIE